MFANMVPGSQVKITPRSATATNCRKKKIKEHKILSITIHLGSSQHTLPIIVKQGLIGDANEVQEVVVPRRESP